MTKSKLFRRILTPEGVCIRSAAEGEEPSREIEGYALKFGAFSDIMATENGKPVRENIAAEAVTPELLAASDIKLTIEHDFNRLLGRSRMGKGSLSYEIDETGVKFRCTMPRTAEGDTALELVRRGDIAGCSFMFTIEAADGAVTRDELKTEVIYTVRKIAQVHDFTLTCMPWYPDTEVEARSLADYVSRKKDGDEAAHVAAQLAEMREASKLITK